MAELRFPVPPLADAVVLLRPWHEADVPARLLAFSDPVMHRFSWRTTPYTEADARRDLAAQEAARLKACFVSTCPSRRRDGTACFLASCGSRLPRLVEASRR